MGITTIHVDMPDEVYKEAQLASFTQQDLVDFLIQVHDYKPEAYKREYARQYEKEQIATAKSEAIEATINAIYN